ncbi:DUF4190 domain-containing protein [Agromyces archimandritae]|uniref:DUF4190 domain-containing protein n=1 Tax=Agromyces archimandritae TaxID=2781962 RepID=A0A975IP79_9MICO|nr:DUF4190 domain-containing protein [Agromyces archimandritae]QTX05363.1 DUF4190 domain-containing protein [Agromyces archimandritae]
MSNPAPAAPPARTTNAWAVASIILVWFGAIFGLIAGYIALSQIKRTGEGGRGLALAAVIIGWIVVAAIVLWVIFAVIIVGMSSVPAGTS